jgi:hypothetical protein
MSGAGFRRGTPMLAGAYLLARPVCVASVRLVTPCGTFLPSGTRPLEVNGKVDVSDSTDTCSVQPGA